MNTALGAMFASSVRSPHLSGVRDRSLQLATGVARFDYCGRYPVANLALDLTLYTTIHIPMPYLISAALIGGIVLFSHRRNILRIIDGTEDRFSFTSRVTKV